MRVNKFDVEDKLHVLGPMLLGKFLFVKYSFGLHYML